MQGKFANVIVDISHENVDRPFAYRIPERLRGIPEPGMQVTIPFGRGNTLRTGYIIEVTDEADFDESRMKELDMTAYVQPVFINGDMHIAPARLGEARLPHAYAWGEMARQGVALAFGTDCPVEHLNPMEGIYCAVTRRDFAGAGPFLPEQAKNGEPSMALADMARALEALILALEP